jgi:hypothetical protein
MNCRTIITTCNKSVELNNLVASCQQAGNKQCEHIPLTSCWNSIATSLLQVCYNLCVFTCVRGFCVFYRKQNQIVSLGIIMYMYYYSGMYYCCLCYYMHACAGLIKPQSHYITRKNAQVVTSLQTSCYKSVHKLSTSCVRIACSQLL